MMRIVLAAIALALVGLIGVIGYRTMSFPAAPPSAQVQVPDISAYGIDSRAASTRLAEAIRFQTVSLASEGDDRSPFENFHAWLEQRYPAFHAAARRETVHGLSLLYTWQGSDPSLPPILLLAHQDVVPVPDDTRQSWRIDPFAGEIRDGAVWGRGAIDDKGSLVALLEAAEYLAAQGRRPVRTVLLAFGHDEERGGEGATATAALLAQRGVRVWFVLDEGMVVLDEHPITGKPAALIGVAEKGFVSLRVVARGQPGHSSMPPRETAVSVLADAVGRIHGMPIRRDFGGGPAMDMMRALGADLNLTNRVVLANEWLFAPLLHARLANDPRAQALLGTTVAPTMISGGVRPNVLPAEATAIINLRIHPRDTARGLLQRARAAVKELDGVSVELDGIARDASPVSSARSPSYALIASLARATAPAATVAPSLVLGGTDSRLYADVAENVYRHQPIVLTSEDIETVHGVNERLSVANLERMIRFYVGLIEAGAMR